MTERVWGSKKIRLGGVKDKKDVLPYSHLSYCQMAMDDDGTGEAGRSKGE